ILRRSAGDILKTDSETTRLWWDSRRAQKSEVRMDLKTAKDLEPSPEFQKDWTFLLCIFLLLAGLSYFLLPGLCCGGGLTQAREGTASSLILQLSQAAKLYELDYAGGRVARRG